MAKQQRQWLAPDLFFRYRLEEVLFTLNTAKSGARTKKGSRFYPARATHAGRLQINVADFARANYRYLQICARRHLLMVSTLETRLCAQKCTFCVSPFGCMVLCGKTVDREREKDSTAFLFFVAAPFFIIHFQAPLRRKWKEKYRWLNSYLVGEFNDQPCFSPIPPSSLLSHSLRILGSTLYMQRFIIYSLSQPTRVI